MLFNEYPKISFVTNLIFIEITAREHGNGVDDFRYGDERG